MKRIRIILLCTVCLFSLNTGYTQMTIHVINVGQGNCVFVEGPPNASGKRKTLIFDGGKEARGHEIVDYLTEIGYPPSSTTFDFMIVSHKDADHFEGFMEVLDAGYDIDVFYDNKSPKKQGKYDNEFMPDVRKIARKVYKMKSGYVLNLGDGAAATCAVVNGELIGGSSVFVDKENDRSIGMVFKYGDFEFFSGGDLGGGKYSKDSKCTKRSTTQRNVETKLAKAMIQEKVIDRNHGLEVLHVSHHGSESSTNHEFMNALSPSVAVISVGQNQSSSYEHPRVDIVERVLMAEASCIKVKPALVLQTESGLKSSKTSNEGFTVGDIIIEVLKNGEYLIESTGDFQKRDFEDKDESDDAGLPLKLKVDK